MFDGQFKNNHVYLVAVLEDGIYYYLGFYAKINFAVRVDNTLTNNQLVCIQSIDLDNAPKSLKTTEFGEDSKYVIAAEVDDAFMHRYSVAEVPEYVIIRMAEKFEREVALRKLAKSVAAICKNCKGKDSSDRINTTFAVSDLDLIREALENQELAYAQ